MKIKVISYNIWHGKYLDKVIEFLKKENADIVQLQEVASKGIGLKSKSNINTFETISKSLADYDASYMRTIWRPEGKGEYDMGPATFVKKSLGNATFEHYFYYKNLASYEGEWTDIGHEVPRGVIITQVSSLPNTYFANTHFVWTKNGQSTKHQQQIAKNLMRSLIDKEQLIFSGDLNTPYNNVTYKIFTTSLVDASLPTVPTLHPTIHAVGEMGYHVDYIMYRGENISHHNTSIPVVDASDHLPIIAEFKILSA